MFTRSFGLGCLLALFVLALVNAPHTRAAPQAVFTVTTTNDADDGICDAAHCSLREAINAANNSGAAGVINFNIVDFPPFVIQPTWPLPVITQNGIQIDGYTQLGAIQNTDPAASNANLMIELSGSAAGATSGLVLAGGNGSVRGLAIYNWAGAAVSLNSNANTVAGNFIGLGTDGMTGLSNYWGIVTQDWTSGNVIGGDISAERNVISFNAYGVYARGSGQLIVGNLIGTSANGTIAKPNDTGIYLETNNSVVRNNVVSGNNEYGILLGGGARKNTFIQNNIGADPTITSALPNGFGGIALGSGAKKNRIGGVGGDSNLIANNGGSGIILKPNAGKGNILRGNAFVGNALLAIDLNEDGVTPNDKFDADGGPNLLQNFPQIKSAESTPRRIRGSISTAPNVTVTLDFYASYNCSASGFGEGLFYLGSTTVTTNGKGKTAFDWISPNPFFPGAFITATATVKKSTSEFSACAIASAG